MACHVFKLPNKRGSVDTVIACGPTPRRKKCAVCGDPNAGALCDYPTANGGTCDKALCYRHRIHVGKDRDYCLDHDLTKPAPVQGRLF